MNRLIFRIVVIVVVLAAATVARPAKTRIDPNETPKHLRNGAVGLKLGFLNAGRVTVDDNWRVDLDAAACGGVFFDVPLMRRLQATAAVDVYDVRFFNVSQRFIDVSMGFKGVTYSPRTRLAFKPAVSVGLGYLAKVGPVRPSTFLTVKGFLEMMVFTQTQYAVVFDFGWVMAPVGTSNGSDITVAPSLFLRAGLAL